MSDITMSSLKKSEKNDYSMSFKNGTLTVFFMEYVHSIPYALKWVAAAKHPKTGQPIKWDRVNIYNRRTREFLGTLRITSQTVSLWT